MEFCPTCGMLLQIDPPRTGRRLSMVCPACPYVFPIERKIVKREKLVKKVMAPVFSAAEARKSLPTAQTSCPRCSHKEAYYDQRQIRSADEPASIFYKCCNENCQHAWRED